MINVDRTLRASDDRWAERSASVWSATATVVVAWGLIALNRLGGLALSEPRSFARETVVGIWGWLALGVSVWAAIHAVARLAADGAPVRSRVPLVRVLSVAGWAHAPVVALAVVVFIAAGALRILGPGLAVATVVFVVAVPFALVTGVRHVADSSFGQATAMVAFPYLVWLLVVIRVQLGSIQHLL